MTSLTGQKGQPTGTAITPTSAAFREWLTRRIAELPPGSPLASDEKFAEHWKISHSTVRRVVRALAREGKLVRVRGKGTFVPATDETPAAQVLLHTSSPQDLADQLVRSISTGRLRVGDPLPSSKWLCYKFHVTSSTVRKAYAELRARNLAMKIGKRYFVATFQAITRSPSQKPIVLLAPERSRLDASWRDQELPLILNRVESELLRYGYALQFGHARDLEGIVRKSIEENRPVHGYILGGRHGRVFVTDDVIDDVSERLSRLYRRALQKRPPLLAMTISTRKRYRGLHVFSSSHLMTQQVRTLARYLFGKGHRRACFFAEEPEGYKWSFLRCFARLHGEFRHLHEDSQIRLVIRRTRSTSDDRLRRRTREIVSPGELWLLLSKYLPQAPADLYDYFPATSARNLRYHRYLDERMWLFYDERLAVQALRWCRVHGVKVPEQTQIIALSRYADCLEHGITSCVPDWDAAGYAMAHALIGDIPVARSGRGYLDTQARMLERLTTR